MPNQIKWDDNKVPYQSGLDASGTNALVAQLDASPTAGQGFQIVKVSNVPSSTETDKPFTGSFTVQAGAQTTQNLTTVTTGKTLRITDIFVSSNSATSEQVSLQANGVTIWTGWVSSSSPLELSGLKKGPSASSGQALTLIAPANAATQGIAYYIGSFESA
jgi:hypothetical protein